MRLNILVLLLLSGLLLAVAPPARAAKKSRAVPKAVDADSEEIPAFNWAFMSSGYIRVFGLRNEEIESTEPNRFFPASAAFALGRIDEEGHFLLLKRYPDLHTRLGRLMGSALAKKRK